MVIASWEKAWEQEDPGTATRLYLADAIEFARSCHSLTDLEEYLEYVQENPICLRHYISELKSLSMCRANLYQESTELFFGRGGFTVYKNWYRKVVAFYNRRGYTDQRVISFSTKERRVYLSNNVPGSSFSIPQCYFEFFVDYWDKITPGRDEMTFRGCPKPVGFVKSGFKDWDVQPKVCKILGTKGVTARHPVHGWVFAEFYFGEPIVLAHDELSLAKFYEEVCIMPQGWYGNKVLSEEPKVMIDKNMVHCLGS